MEHEVTESQKKPPKGLLKPQTNLDDIALSAVNVKALIIPVGNTKALLFKGGKNLERGAITKASWNGGEQGIIIHGGGYHAGQEVKQPQGT